MTLKGSDGLLSQTATTSTLRNQDDEILQKFQSYSHIVSSVVERMIRYLFCMTTV